jgi:hypothetical protein
MKQKMNYFVLTSLASACLLSSQALAEVPADSPYRTDLQFTHNKDYTADALKIIGIVSCYVRSMAPEVAYNKVGTAPYVALVDQNKCEESDQGSSGNSGSTALTTNFATSVVQGAVDSNGVLTAKVWMAGKDESGIDIKTAVNVSITGGPAKSPPYGQWEVNWCDLNTAETSCTSKGHARVDATGMRAYINEQGSGWSNEMSVLGDISADEKSGGGRFISKKGNGNVIQDDVAGYYAFEPGLMYSKFTDNQNSSSSEQCLLPDSSRPGTLISTWETWLYDTQTGQKKDVNSGFQIKDAEGNWGWAGYWGVNFGNKVPANGATVSKVDNNGNTVGSYSVQSTIGKMHKIEVTPGTLNNLVNLPLRGWGPKSLATGVPSDSSQWVNLSYKWDGTNFIISSYQICTNQCTETAVGPVPISLDELSGTLNQDNMSAWLDGTNTNYNIIIAKWDNPNNTWTRVRFTNPSDVVVKSRTDTVVNPDDANIPTSLFCVGQCVDSNLNIVQEHNVEQSGVRQYTWNASNGSLKYGSTGIDFTSNSNNSYYSGVLVSQNDLSELACKKWDGQTNVDAYCEWYADNKLSTYYRWESGPNSHNRYVGLKDSSNNLVTFSPPMNLTYQVPQNDTYAGDYAGKTVSIQYPGGGNLWIPGYCFDPTSPSRARKQCDSSTDWANEFVIPYDTTTGIVTETSTNNQYYVKTLKRGVFFPMAQNGACNAGLQTTAQNYSSRTLPTINDWKSPIDPTSPGYIGTWKDPTGTPLIIDGVLQTQ